jgi:saccharopine dehydrogenase-like NADP-dependent oxidoreductase
MLELKIGDHLQEESLKKYLSILEGVCDRKYADELISQAEKNIREYAKTFESKLQRAEKYRENEEIKFIPCVEAPEYENLFPEVKFLDKSRITKIGICQWNTLRMEKVLKFINFGVS